jgi:hypothetical protein
MAFKTIEFNVDSGVATLTLNRPDRLNSFKDARGSAHRDEESEGGSLHPLLVAHR